MKKFAIIGVYGQGENFTTGQAVKCYELINWFIEKYSAEDILIVNTYKWKKHPLKLFITFIKAFKECETIIMLPAQHGLKIFAPLCYKLNKKYKRKIEYIVIGGWLADMLNNNNKIKKYVSNFDGVFAETKSMVENLKKIGIYNSYYLPNTRLIPNDIKRNENWNKYINVCTYSRVTEDKGIIDAIEIVKEANKIIGKNLFHLDIYGKIAPEFEKKLNKAIEENSSFVKYCGIKNSNQGVETLANYFCLLFPTYYEGEGLAGTLLDAFAAGTPILANDWKYNREIINDKETGLIYPYRNIKIAAKELCSIYNDRKMYKKIQKNLQVESKQYTPDVVYKKFLNIILKK